MMAAIMFALLVAPVTSRSSATTPACVVSGSNVVIGFGNDDAKEGDWIGLLPEHAVSSTLFLTHTTTTGSGHAVLRTAMHHQIMVQPRYLLRTSPALPNGLQFWLETSENRIDKSCSPLARPSTSARVAQNRYVPTASCCY